jgi:hypothetical protein
MERDKYDPIRPLPALGESSVAFRQRAEAIQFEAAEWRRQQLAEQSSPLNTPSVRIGAWERLHQVDLPSNPAHRLVDVIAANTGLTTAEVRAEQQTRAAGTK